MFRNYFKIALRHLQKNKLYALVNIVGLAIGIASCLLIGIYTWHELSFDRFHQNADRIARVTWEYDFGDAQTKTASTGTKVGPQLKRTFPEVMDYVRVLKYQRVIDYNKVMYDEKDFLYADSAFFSIFSFKLLKGDPATVLDAPEKLVITTSMAAKYFGNEDPIGKTVKVGGMRDFVVTGIAEDVPENSQIQFDFVGSFKTLNASKTEKWDEANYITYLLLNHASSMQPLQDKIVQYAKEVGKTEMQVQGNDYMTFHLEPFTKVHLHSRLDGLEPNNNIIYIYVLGAVALLILLVACVNYTNLSTAQSSGRSAEIGMRKVMGAGKQQVFNQFISESFILTMLAVVVAVTASVFLMPYFNELTGKQFSKTTLLSPVVLLILLVFSLFVALAAGAYPALILSKGKVIHILKSGFQFTGSPALRKSLIVFQFVISIFLIIATIVILQQLSFIRNKDIGYSRDQVLVIPADQKVQEDYETLKKALSMSPGVKSVSGAYEAPTHIGWGDGLQKGTGGDGPSITINAFPVDEDIVKTLGLKIIAGADYNQTDVLQFDTSDEGRNLRYSFMLNESAVKALGWTPEEAVGKTVTKGREGIVKAVVKDFHFRSLHEPINALAIFMDRRLVNTIFIKLSDSPTASTLGALEKIWKARMPHRPFEYSFLDEEYDSMYKTEQRIGRVFTTFSLLAILLASLGLFALTAYAMVQRTREIGIRKVLGATVPDILTLVSKDFLKLVLAAFVIAIPIALLVVNKWLESFAYRTELHWWIFLMAGIATLAIAIVTICLQALKTATANPIKNLRTE